MTSPAEWREEDLPSTLLVIAPHPDDEVLGCGFLMRRVAAAGGRVMIAWMTDGGGSHGELDAGARGALVARRQGEALAGVAELGVSLAEACFLGCPDGGLGADGERMAQALDRLQHLCDRHAVETVVVTAADDGHPDHRAAFAIAQQLAVARIYSYPISTKYDGEAYASPPGAVCIPPGSGDLKRHALARHVSQREQGGAIYPLSAATIDRFCAEPEIFLPIARLS